ncbi:MAG: pyridoxal phosphate-dependent aminotransferase [Candidatus Hodarchaeales archaeon]
MKIRLNMNEMPYPPPTKVIQAGEKGLFLLNRYNFPEDRELLQKLLAEYSGVPKDHIIVYPGSDLILREIVHMFAKERKVIMAYPTFFPTFYAATENSMKMSKIPLEPPDFVLNTDHLFNELNEPSLIIIDNPNNPTGKILLDREIVKTILDNENALLVIDEAYFEFSKGTYADMVEEYPNLAIGRTISKAFGLAGARIGYIIGGKTFLNKFASISIMLPQVGVYSAIEAMKNPEYIEKNINLIYEERERVSKELNEIGIQVYPSTTNFLLINTKISDIGTKLKKRGISVLDLSDRWLSGYIRVSIGTNDENDFFLSNLRAIL